MLDNPVSTHSRLDGFRAKVEDDEDSKTWRHVKERKQRRCSPTLHRNSGDVEIAIDEDFKAIARPSMVGCYIGGKTKSSVNIMPNKIRSRKARKHQKRQQARSPLDLQDFDLDEILQQIKQKEAYSSRTSDTSTLVEKDLNRRDQSLAIAGLQKDSQQQSTVNPEEKEKEETVTLQPFKGTPLIISDLQKKNDIMKLKKSKPINPVSLEWNTDTAEQLQSSLNYTDCIIIIDTADSFDVDKITEYLGKKIQERHYQAVRLAGGAPGNRDRRFVKGKTDKNGDLDKNIYLHDVLNKRVKTVSVKDGCLYRNSKRDNIRDKIKQSLELNPIHEESLYNNNVDYGRKENNFSDNCVTVDKKQHCFIFKKMYDRDAQYMHCDEMKRMQNEYNNCWFNSVIQSFIRIPQFFILLMYVKISFGDVANNELLKIMRNLLRGHHQGNILPMSEIKIAYTAVCDTCFFKYNEQQDAFEFISKAIFPFLEACEMLEYFLSKSCEYKMCLSCKTTSCRTFPLHHFTMPIPDATANQSVDIQDIIDNYALKSAEKEAQKCDFCTGEEALVEEEIIQSPQVMVIHLQRQLPNSAKIHTRVNVKEKVEVQTKTSIASYQLISVIQHHGKSASHGHYTAKVRNGKRYVIMDDEKCLEERECNFVDSEESAYIAIYHKTDDVLFSSEASNGIRAFPEIVLN